MKSVFVASLLSVFVSTSAFAKTTFDCEVVYGKPDGKPGKTIKDIHADVKEFDVDDTATSSAHVKIPNSKTNLSVDIYAEFQGEKFLHYAFRINAYDIKADGKSTWVGQTDFYSDVLPRNFGMNLFPFTGARFFLLNCKR